MKIYALSIIRNNPHLWRSNRQNRFYLLFPQTCWASRSFPAVPCYVLNFLQCVEFLDSLSPLRSWTLSEDHKHPHQSFSRCTLSSIHRRQCLKCQYSFDLFTNYSFGLKHSFSFGLKSCRNQHSRLV